MAKSRGNSVDFRGPRLTTRSALPFSPSQLAHPAVVISRPGSDELGSLRSCAAGWMSLVQSASNQDDESIVGGSVLRGRRGPSGAITASPPRQRTMTRPDGSAPSQPAQPTGADTVAPGSITTYPGVLSSNVTIVGGPSGAPSRSSGMRPGLPLSRTACADTLRAINLPRKPPPSCQTMPTTRRDLPRFASCSSAMGPASSPPQRIGEPTSTAVVVASDACHSVGVPEERVIDDRPTGVFDGVASSPVGAQARVVFGARGTRRRRLWIVFSAAALVLVSGAIATGVTLRHLDHQYGPIEGGDFFGIVPRQVSSSTKNGSGFACRPLRTRPGS